jgi:hypothetical protein
VSLWVFTLDDLFDEKGLPEPELLRCAEHYRAIALDLTAPPADNSLAAALGDVCHELARYPLFSSIGQRWAAATCGTIDGMLREYRWGAAYRQLGVVALPTYQEYLENGRYSIGGPPHVWAAVVTTNDPLTPLHLNVLQSMEEVASTCIRLANDLQSYAKEVDEGKFNAITLLRRAREQDGIPPGEARLGAETSIREQIARGLDDLARLRVRAQTQTGYPEAAIDDIARFVCEFYAQHDFHTFESDPVTQPGAP